MKITSTTLSVLALSVAPSLAFAPASQRAQASRHPTLSSKDQQSVASQTFGRMQSTLLMNKNQDTGADNAMEDLKEKLDERTKFLTVDLNQARQDLAANWPWIVGSGVLTMALGAAAFGFPLFATGVAYDTTVLTLGASALVGLLSVFVRENGHKVKSGLSGLGYGAVAYYMATHPAQGLDIITLTIATVIATEGLYELALAIKNENLQARGWHALSGVVSTIAGLWLSASLPVASLVTPGAALGTRLTSQGASKVAVGLAGKDIAQSTKRDGKKKGY